MKLVLRLAIAVICAISAIARAEEKKPAAPAPPAAAAEITVKVLGEVKHPGDFQLEAGATLLDALGRAGLAGHAKTDAIRLVRTAANGSKSVVVINVRKMLQTGGPAYPLKNGDEIFVPSILCSLHKPAVNSA